MSNAPVKAATASNVREHFRSNAEALASLTPAAQNTVRVGARGRLHPEAIAAFNKGKSKAARYSEGNEKVIELSFKHTQPSGRTVNRVVNVPESQARVLAGALAGKRGPLSAAAKVAAGKALAAQS